MFLPALAHDLRIALRGWRRVPGGAANAILTLALGIGASTALFTVVHAILIQPLPYRDSDRLIVVRAEQDFEGASRPVRTLFSTEAVAAWPREMTAFSRLAFYADGVGALNEPTGSELVSTAVVDGPFFETLDGPLMFGRGVGLLLAAGSGLGLLGALAATRILSALLFGVAATDPAVVLRGE